MAFPSLARSAPELVADRAAVAARAPWPLYAVLFALAMLVGVLHRSPATGLLAVIGLLHLLFLRDERRCREGEDERGGDETVHDHSGSRLVPLR